MNQQILLSKLKNRTELIKENVFERCRSIEVLQGVLYEDGGDIYDASTRTLKLSEGTIWGEARKSFRAAGTFRIDEREGFDSVLRMELGHSKSLETLAFLYGPEAVVYIDGKEAAGLDPNHQDFILGREYADGKPHEVILEGWTGIREEDYRIGFLGTGHIHRKTLELAYMAQLCLQTAESERDAPLSEWIRDAVQNAFLKLDLREPLGNAFRESTQEALDRLCHKLQKIPYEPVQNIIACGHGHLDLAWLWRSRQSVKKGVRTFLNALNLMERYPDFYFSQTQAQLYEWIENAYPDVFSRMREYIKNGQWELLGGMWVEPDCNITGGESLIRQFLLYERYMTEHFETIPSPVVWLPDTFGFCGQLPQIMKSAGIRYFATAKLTWNQYNKMPSEYFWWQGIDGSRILSYLVTASKPKWWGATYSAELTPEEMTETIRGQTAKAVHKELLIAYGMGDGGGGPTEKMVLGTELMEKYALPCLPKVRKGKFIDFFQRLEKEKGEELPVWDGELYFELHRGTYTSQAETKRLNRLCETKLHEAEFLAAWAAEETEQPYPYQELNHAWKLVCLNQFHDILPGSSIGAVYQDAAIQYKEVLQIGETVCEKSMLSLESLVKPADYMVLNTTPFQQSAYTELPVVLQEGQCILASGKALMHCSLPGKTMVYVEEVPAYGFQTVSVSDNASLPVTEEEESVIYAGARQDYPYQSLCAAETCYVLENALMRVELDYNADLVKWTDLEKDRQLVTPGKRAAEWQLFEDRPNDWDAWDIDEFYKEKGCFKAVLILARPFRTGSEIAGFVIEKRIGNSFISQTIHMDRHSKDLKFKIRIHFQEKRELLRIAFLVEIHHEEARFGTQFGSVLRSTHYNNTWDQAKFETCMHRWCDYAEGDYGISMLCDHKYGVDIHEQTISLTVLKSAVFPDPEADRGSHAFQFTLVPHTGCAYEESIQKAYLLQQPFLVHKLMRPDGELDRAGMISCGNCGLIIETLKRAEDGSGTVLRAYEAFNTRGKARIRCFYEPVTAIRQTVLEKGTEKLRTEKKEILLEYHPYEIISIKTVR